MGPAAGLAAWGAERGRAEQAAAEIFRSFAEFSPEGAALHEKLSAEIHSLAKMDLDRHDRMVFLASATDDGYACALAVEMYLKKYWEGLAVVTERIAGLQVRDARLFRQQGVVKYLRRCLREVHDYGRENVVLNPTGGFKALVPYTVLIGMLKRVPCRYIFERDIEELSAEDVVRAGQPQPREYRRCRSKHGGPEANRAAGMFRLTFSHAIPGPLSLGDANHFGMGRFVPAADLENE